MAKDYMAQLLDEMMGRGRNLAPNEQKDLNWDDESVCKHYLVNYCPNELFTNTKADLGICRLIHDDKLAEKYRASPKKGTLGYEDKFMRFLQDMIQEVDRRIDRGRGRLEATKQVAANTMGAKFDDRIRDLADKIEALVKEAEELGGQGKVEEAQLKLRLSDQLRKDRDGVIATMESAVQQEKQLEVCQTCGAFLIVGDAQQRIDDHLSGKQHVGYARIKQTLKEEEEKLAKELEERRKARDGGRESSRGKSEKSDRKDVSARDRDRDRDRSRDRHRRQRSVERDHQRRRSRSRSKESKHSRHGRDVDSRRRDRSGSHSRRSSATKSSRHDRNRSRDRSRERRRRSREREERRRRRSPSEEKRSSKSRRRSSSSGSSSGKKRTADNSNGHTVAAAFAVIEDRTENEKVPPSLDSIHLPKNKFVPAMPMEEEEEEETTVAPSDD
ncbi:Luc7-like protein 3 [Hypsibius exemplaris]|uniref:Luc7-like protein 3 n=1 Tax=Hypsibius exemplaris TaxID=2072580 RepID=A0A1W0X112_HYPEX|nr:Luc7-like protein 3 [Hypsibius exemplaris]